MKLKILAIVFLLFPMVISAQFTEDFSDGDFTANPTWSGDESDFEIDASNRLHLNAPAETSTSYLSTASESIVDASWEFTVELDFNPTSSNMAQVFLVSNAQDLVGDLQGYFVRIGNTTKEVSLYRQDGLGDVEEIIDGNDNEVDMDVVNVRVKVTRSALGNWELLADNNGGEDYVSVGTVQDEMYASSQFFGVHCKYTSTRSDKFFFSNFIVSGTGFVDVVPPTVISYDLPSNNQVSIVYSEAMDEMTTTAVANYSVSDGVGNPSTVDLIGSDEVLLTFSESFNDSQEYLLSISNIEDLGGNALNTEINIVYYEISVADIGDVIINEIMADPSPVVGLPEVEFIELFNRSDNAFDLNDWNLVNTTSDNLLSGILAAGEFVILCDEEDAEQLSAYGNTLGISSFSAVSNSADSLTLISSNGEIMDIVSYNTSWYQNSTLSNGGYTLERINPFLVCSGSNNWRASSANLGGTPGIENSVFDETPDLLPPNLLEVYVNSETQIALLFNEILLPEDVANADFSIDNDISVLDAELVGNDLITLQLNPALSSSVLYEVTVNDLQDCAGNIILDNNQSLFGLTEDIEPNDIVINEILSNPRPDGVDFIEIYNNSDKFLSLSNSKIARIADGILDDVSVITANDKILFPGDYLILTEDKTNIVQEYPSSVAENILMINNVPSYNDDEGTVVILNAFNEVIDSVYYNDDYHFELLDDEEGVSLERLNFNEPSEDKNNWHSASQTVGFATPGYKNSQFITIEESAAEIFIQPRVISPDNDGFEDVMTIRYSLDQAGFIANISVLDDNGRLINKISQNTLLGVEGTLYWDGLTDDGAKAPIGIYIIYIELFNLEGDVEATKEVVTVAARL